MSPSTAFDVVLDVCDVNHAFGKKTVLHQVNLKIVRGEIVGLVGPSGCGKSTLLRAVIGTHPPLKGRLLMHHPGEAEPQLVSGPGRDRGMVYQHYSLFPHLTAQENVAVGLMLDQTSMLFRFFQYPGWSRLRARHMEQSAAMLEKMRLEDCARLFPQEMSGGMRQRVAIAQALVMKPQVLLLDEPFGALDEQTRGGLQRLLLSLYQENLVAKKEGQLPPHTILIVTHELSEAIYVADRVVAVSQYWNWKEQGFAACPGATVVYDDLAPVFHPDDAIDPYSFVEQREEIRRAAFMREVGWDPATHVRTWARLAAGEGQGVLAS